MSVLRIKVTLSFVSFQGAERCETLVNGVSLIKKFNQVFENHLSCPHWFNITNRIDSEDLGGNHLSNLSSIINNFGASSGLLRKRFSHSMEVH